MTDIKRLINRKVSSYKKINHQDRDGMIIDNQNSICKEIIEKCEDDKKSRKFFLKNFIESLLYYFLYDIQSLRLLETELNPNKLGIMESKFSTMKDAFQRFNYKSFQEI